MKKKRQKSLVTLIAVFLLLSVGGFFFKDSLIGNGGKLMSFMTTIRRQYQLEVPPILAAKASALNMTQHWKGQYGHFVLVAQPNSSYFRQADGRKILGTLGISDRVKVLFVKPYKSEDDELDGVPRWVFVSSESGRKLYGWMRENKLAYKTHFEPLTNWDFQSNWHFSKQQFKADVVVYDNARFQMNWNASGNGLHLKGAPQGRFYQYEKLLWAKMEKPSIWEHFFYQQGNAIYVESFLSKTEQKVRPNL